MPLVAAKMKKDLETAILAGLMREHKDDIKANPKAADAHKKMAAALSDIANVIVLALLTEAQIAPGIPVVGAGGGVPGPMSGVTTAPGKIL